MKSMITVGLTAAILAVMLLVSGFFGQSPAAAQSQSQSPTNTAEGYLLREEDGFLTIFRQPEGTLVAATEIDVRTLTQADQRTAREGFFVESQQQLEQLIEDLES